MKVCSLLFQDREQLRREVHHADISPEEECLVRIYTACEDKDGAVALAREVRRELPAAKIIGGTGSGVIFRGKQYEGKTLVVVEQFAHTEVLVSTFCFAGKPAAVVAREVASSFPEEEVPAMHILCGDHYPDVYGFLEEFKRQNQATKLSGGVMGDILPQGIAGYVFTDEGVVDHGIVTAALKNRALNSFCGVNIAHEPISPVYKLTRGNGSLLLEIEGEPALNWAADQFGAENLREYHEDWRYIAQNDILVRFPMMLEGHGGASRFVKYDAGSKCISLYFSRLEAGLSFRIGYTSPTKCAQECFELCSGMINRPVESLFCYSCLFRKMYLGNCAEWELRPFSGYQICGVFMMGEIGNVHGVNEFLNGSCCFMGVGEEDAGLQPDLNVFEDLYKIKDANDSLHSFALKRFSVAASEQNRVLLEELLFQQKRAEEQLYIDANTGLHSTIMYSMENQKYHFNKLFMAKIENAALLISQLGQNSYRAMIIALTQKIEGSPSAAKFGNKIHYYALNESALFMAASDSVPEEAFLKYCNELYEAYHLVSMGGGIVVINRFVVVMDQPNLLESALNTLRTSQNLQTHFLVCDNNRLEETQAEEIKLLQVLSRAIESDGVVPYFQGIYDNNERRITKYEALMRLRDTDGTLYAPAAFMEISKQYHMYSILSQKMLSQVFDLFAGKGVCVSVNLSALDINLKDMQEWILERLEGIGDASNFTFEILEDEQFQDMEALRGFIGKVRQYGVRIAIDDFGSGYSNFMEIAKIEPDFLKVDGSIVRNIRESVINRKVLQNIVFLGGQLQAGVVAEFVENEDIQKKVESFGIAHSQGYYFAKPLPYDQIVWKDEKEPE